MNLAGLPLPPRVRDILAAALDAVDPYRAVRRALESPDPPTRAALAAARRVVVLAVGKAAFPMAQAARDLLGPRIARGVVVTKAGHAGGPLPGFRTVFGGHPLPTVGSQRAAAAVLQAVHGLQADDVVLLLLSGGGSALMTAPRLPLTLTDLQRTTQLLLASGATIAEVNTVRKHLDAVKGGGLAQAAAPATVVALVLSDVLGNPLDVIASGPAVPDPTTFDDAWAVLTRYGLVERVPAAVREVLRRGRRGEVPETPKPGAAFFHSVHHRVVGDVAQAVEAAAKRAAREGFHTAIAATALQGEAREIGRGLAAVLREMAERERPLPRPACLLLGGETTVTLGESYGRGGRNQELALAAVEALDGLRDAYLVAFATDGADGPTDAAGAVAQADTLRRARARGLSPAAYLRQHDAYAFWQAVGGLLRTGPTQTNVNDLILLCTGALGK